jgi:hypothetical protein
LKNEEVLQRVKGERNFLHTIERRKADWTGHILHRNCLLQHVMEGKIQGTMEGARRRGRRHKQLLEIERGSTRLYSGEFTLKEAMDLS